MAVETAGVAVQRGAHGVQFYEHDVELVGSEHAVRARFPAERESPGHARRLVVDRLRQWGHGEVLVQDTGLVLSELATNAVLHASSAFSIAVRVQDAIISVGVQDGSPLAGSARDAGLIPRRGHGLGLIDALSLRWGVERVLDGKVVWAELPRG